MLCDKIKNISSSYLEPQFICALCRLANVYYELELSLSHSDTNSIKEYTAVFPILDDLYGELRNSVLAFDDDPSLEQSKRRHIQAFRSCAGKYVWQAAFAWHAYQKPRGYPGDFEMMEMIYRDNRSCETQFGRLLQTFFMQGPGPRSVRGKYAYILQYLRNFIEQYRKMDNGSLRILSLGCGSALELRDLFALKPKADLDVTLFDQDQDALERAQTLLTKVQKSQYHIRKIQDSVYSIAKRNSLSGQRFDVIYSMGLFDYLPKDFARVLTHKIFPLLTPGGELIIANCSDNPINPDRFFMEYALDWFVRQRSDNAMKELVSDLPARSTRINRDDETRTIAFLHVVSNNIENA